MVKKCWTRRVDDGAGGDKDFGFWIGDFGFVKELLRSPPGMAIGTDPVHDGPIFGLRFDGGRGGANMTPEYGGIRSTGSTAAGTQSLGQVLRDLAAELVGLIRRDHHVAPGSPDKADRVGWSVVAVILGALVGYTGLMFLLWGGVVGIWLGLTAAGMGVGTAACAAFLIMGAIWSVAGYIVAQAAIHTLRREPIETEQAAATSP
jgi:hypothetical protein